MRAIEMKAIIVIILLASLTFNTFSQPARIGKPCPSFTLKDINYYPVKRASLKDFKGKWLVLDIWNERCSGCIASMPKTSHLQRVYEGKIQFMLLGDPSEELVKIKTFYEKLRARKNINLPIVYDDRLANQLAGGSGYPLYIVIDPEGIVRARTYRIDSIHIRDFLAGRQPLLPISYPDDEMPSKDYNAQIPLLINNNGGDEQQFLYRSVLAKWQPTMPPFDIAGKRGGIEAIGMNLKQLYMLAFFGKGQVSEDDSLYGKVFPSPVLEVSDSSLFQPDDISGKNKFSYSLIIADDSVDNFGYLQPRFQKMMQSDLSNNFPYTASWETRKMPYLKLVINDRKLLERFKSDKKELNFQWTGGYAQGFTATGYQLFQLMGWIRFTKGYPRNVIALDDTGFTDRIDVTMQEVYYEDMLEELKKHGLALITAVKEMSVLVIRDAPTNTF